VRGEFRGKAHDAPRTSADDLASLLDPLIPKTAARYAGGRIASSAAGADSRLSRGHVRAELGRAVAGNRHAPSPPVGAVRGLISTPICLALGGGSHVPRNRPPLLPYPGPARGINAGTTVLAILDYRG
jgi:hypothetical protein